MQLKSILCPIDFSEFSVMAYQYALSVAEHYDARVIVLHMVEMGKYPFADYGAYEADFAKVSRALAEGGEVQLREFVKKHGGIHQHFVVKVGNASDAILSFAQAENIDLIVMGTHGRRGFDRLVLGSTTDRVMRRACCPVLVISKPQHASITADLEKRHAHNLSRILYCCDFCGNTGQALNYAISVTAEYEAELTLLHVIERTPGFTAKDEPTAPCAKELEKLVPPEARSGLNAKYVVKIGKPYQQIVQYASEMHPDMIVMAARGTQALDRAVFGSTTYRVIQLGPCPVLVVHT